MIVLAASCLEQKPGPCPHGCHGCSEPRAALGRPQVIETHDSMTVLFMPQLTGFLLAVGMGGPWEGGRTGPDDRPGERAASTPSGPVCPSEGLWIHTAPPVYLSAHFPYPALQLSVSRGLNVC